MAAPFISSCPQENTIKSFGSFPVLEVEGAVDVVMDGVHGLVASLFDSLVPSKGSSNRGIKVKVELGDSWNGGDLLGVWVGANGQRSVPAVPAGRGTWTVEFPEQGGCYNYLFLCDSESATDDTVLAGPALVECRNR